MKKKLKTRECVLIGFILIVIVFVGWQIIAKPTKLSKDTTEKKSFEVNDIAQPKEEEGQNHKQPKKLRPIGHTVERTQENKLMAYRLQQVKQVDPYKVDVVRWPNDQNDQWVDSQGKAYPVGRYTGQATIRDNPSKDLKYIRKYGGGEAFIGLLNGEKGVGVPTRKKINGETYLISHWMWLDSRTLVGVMSHDLAPGDYTEYGDTRICLYKINSDLKSGKLVEVSTPFIPHRSTIKIEGVTSSGALALSRVYDGAADGIKFNFQTKKYSSSGYEPEKFLGVFSVDKQSP